MWVVIVIAVILLLIFYYIYYYSSVKRKLIDISGCTCLITDFDLLLKHYRTLPTKKLKIIKDKIKLIEPERNSPFLNHWLTLMVLLLTIVTNILVSFFEKIFSLDNAIEIFSYMLRIIFISFLAVYLISMTFSWVNERIHKYTKAHIIVIEHVLSIRTTIRNRNYKANYKRRHMNTLNKNNPKKGNK